MKQASSVIKTTIKSLLKIDFFVSEASHLCHRNKKGVSNKILSRAKRATFARETKNKRCFKLDSFASEASHVCHRNKNQKVFGIRFFCERSEPRLQKGRLLALKTSERSEPRMLESKPKCERSELPASEASHPRERSDREPPAGLASRPGAAGAEGRIASDLYE